MTTSPRRSPSRAGTRERVAAAIDSLDGNDRILLTLCLLEGLSTLEAGAVMRVPSRVVAERLAGLLPRLAGRTRARERGSRRAA